VVISRLVRIVHSVQIAGVAYVRSVSVGQKTVGYIAGSLDFTPDLLRAIDFVDNSIGQVVAKLTTKGLLKETLIIVASKHGQTPIDPTLFTEVNPQAVVNATGVDVLFQTVSGAYFGWQLASVTLIGISG
jgi:Type I phosphodiesterase / nucleotide pyrophosphatase